MDKKIAILGLIFGAFSIILGAFGAHGLKKVLPIDQLTSFETGIKYLVYHALFLLFLSQTQLLVNEQKTIVFYTTLVGVLFFSGSIFLLSTQSISNINFKILGPITPIGGLFLLFSWVITIYYIVVKN